MGWGCWRQVQAFPHPHLGPGPGLTHTRNREHGFLCQSCPAPGTGGRPFPSPPHCKPVCPAVHQGGGAPTPPQTPQESQDPGPRGDGTIYSREGEGKRQSQHSMGKGTGLAGGHSMLRPCWLPRGASAAGVCPGWHAGRRAHSRRGTQSGCCQALAHACGGGD